MRSHTRVLILFRAAGSTCSTCRFGRSPRSTTAAQLTWITSSSVSREHLLQSSPSPELTLIRLADLPDGNTKFTTFEVDTRTVNKPVVRVKVYVDGEEAWRVDVLGKPLPRKLLLPPTAVGSLGKGLRELLTFLRRSFF